MTSEKSSRFAIKHYKKHIIFGVCVFVVGFVFHFPFETISQQILYQVEKNTGIKIQTDSISYALPIGFKARNITLENVPFGQTKRSLSFSSGKVTLSPIELITYIFRKSVSGTITLAGKEISGYVNISSGNEAVSIEGVIKKYVVAETFYVPDPLNPEGILDLNLNGIVSGSFNLSSLTKPLQQGNISFIEGPLKLKMTKALITGPIIGELLFDQISLDSSTKSKRTTLRSLSMDGPALSAKSSGNIELRPSVLRSILKLDGQVQIGKEGDKFKTFLNIAGIRLDNDGSGAFKVSGPLNRLRLKSY